MKAEQKDCSIRNGLLDLLSVLWIAGCGFVGLLLCPQWIAAGVMSEAALQVAGFE